MLHQLGFLDIVLCVLIEAAQCKTESSGVPIKPHP